MRSAGCLTTTHRLATAMMAPKPQVSAAATSFTSLHGGDRSTATMRLRIGALVLVAVTMMGSAGAAYDPPAGSRACDLSGLWVDVQANTDVRVVQQGSTLTATNLDGHGAWTTAHGMDDVAHAPIIGFHGHLSPQTASCSAPPSLPSRPCAILSLLL